MDNAGASMESNTGPAGRLRVFFNADVLIAGSASKRGASYVLLQLSELTLIEGVICPYVQGEAERNLYAKLPEALPAFRALLSAALEEVPDPPATTLGQFEEWAHPEDLPVLAAAISNGCPYLVTFNTGDCSPPPERLHVMKPGQLLRQVREQLAKLTEPSTSE